LSVLSKKPGCAQAWMGAYLGLDKTSLSRNLGLMQKNGWIEPAVSEDRRERGYRLTAEGERVLDEAKQGWARAQAKLRAAMDEDDWAAMQRVFERVARAAVEAR
jgi:DNA-binding MarR family transcriptional regulator